MKYWQAMKIIDEGGKVRRANWLVYLKLHEGKVTPHVKESQCQYGVTELLEEEDFIATDWVEV